MITRRAVLAAAGACAASPAERFLDRAIAATGGEAALRRVRQLRWTGQAVVQAGARRLELGVATTVTPFAAARSETWLLSDRPAAKRAMVLEGGDLFQERDGARTPLPAPQARHERQQYALYGLMLLTPLKDSPGALAGLDDDGGLLTRHPLAPPTTLYLDERWRLASAENVVDAPDGVSRIAQTIDFLGEIESRGVRWPARLKIRQDGRPYFDLTLATFEVVT